MSSNKWIEEHQKELEYHINQNWKCEWLCSHTDQEIEQDYRNEVLAQLGKEER